MQTTTQPTPLSDATPQPVAVGGAGDPGVATDASRGDHVHDLSGGGYGSPGNSAVGDVAADGVATTVARADHRHGREAFGNVVAVTYGGAGTNGVAATDARSDHVHPLAVLPAWTIVASGLLASVASLDLAGLSGYKRYRLTIMTRTAAGPGTTNWQASLKINNDTLYEWQGVKVTGAATGVLSGASATPVVVGNTGTNAGFTEQWIVTVTHDDQASSRTSFTWQYIRQQAAATSGIYSSGGGECQTAVAGITEILAQFGVPIDGGNYVLEASNQ